MKPSNNSSNSVTKQDVREEIKRLEGRLSKRFTRIDERLNLMDQKNFNIERGIETRITSSSFDLRQRLEKTFQAQIEISAKELLQKIEEKISKFTNLIITTVDPLLQEIETRQQDREITTHQFSALGGKISNHEGRIKKLELTNQTT